MICVFTFIIGVYSTAERKRSCSQQDGPVNGFHNNFGHSIGGVGYRGEEGVLIANILKPFVSKCVDNARELYGSDNIVCRIVHSQILENFCMHVYINCKLPLVSILVNGLNDVTHVHVFGK